MSDDKKHILIAEDDPLVRKSMAHYLKKWGVEIVEAGTGLEALNLFREKRPDFLLTDLRMPDLDGLELLRIVVTESPETMVARNEWKYVADGDLDPDLPVIPLLADEMGQVILNMLVNAAHAIGDKLGDNPEGDKGTISISTGKVGETVELRIRDTGTGMPENVQFRVFDPFFTTKEVGQGWPGSYHQLRCYCRQAPGSADG